MFDPAAAQSSEIDALFAAGAPAASVLLLAGSRARQGGWSAQAAIALADRCAARGRCILIDLVIDGGELHELLGIDNIEGIADVFLFGASLRHVIERPRGHAFEFAAAGAPSDTATVLEHSRWPRLLGEQEREGVTLLLYAAADAPGLELLSRRVRSAIALATPEDLPTIDERTVEPARVALISPAAAIPAPPAARVEQSTPTETKRPGSDFESIRVPRNAARDALIADLRARQRAALMSPVTGAEPQPADVPDNTPANAAGRPAQRRTAPSISEPTFIGETEPEPVKSRSLLYWLLSLALLAAIIAGAWYFLQQRPKKTRAQQRRVATAPPLAAPTPVEPAANALVYSVAIEAHQQLPLALERVKTLRGEEPEMAFYIAPVVANNIMYYQVMAGPVVDSAAAGALLLRLLEKGHKTGAQPGEVRRAELAFLLGEFNTQGEAEAREKEAAELAIPAYVIEVPQADGSTHFRVYAGAYGSQAEAGVMKQLLQSVGLPDSLVQRVGKQR